MTPRIVSVPYRGLRCRELKCQAELVLVTTTRGKTMPLERDLVALGEDERGLFVVVTGSVDLAARAQDGADGKFVPASTPIACTPKQARELGLNVPPESTVYRAHWSGCVARDQFRR